MHPQEAVGQFREDRAAGYAQGLQQRAERGRDAVQMLVSLSRRELFFLPRFGAADMALLAQAHHLHLRVGRARGHHLRNGAAVSCCDVLLG